MRTWAWIACAGLVVAAADDEKAELGKPVPKFALKTADGKTEVSIEQFRKSEKREGKIVAVHFWSFKCPSGNKALGEVKKFADFCKGKGVEFLAICSYGESPEELEKFRQENKIDYPLLMDEECTVAELFGAKVVTSSYVIGPDGVLLYAGGFRGSRKEKNGVEEALKEVLDGKEVSRKETPAQG